jgi:hypothetical protein
MAAGSLAALALYPRAVTRPVYVLCNSSQSTSDRCAFIDEGAMTADREVNQTTLENFIAARVGIGPTLLTTFQLRAADAEDLVFKYRPDFPNPESTATWMAIVFFPGTGKVPGPSNRLRVMVALERFAYANRLRFAECDLSTSAAVYRKLLAGSASGAIPTEPELWLINPQSRHFVKYIPGDGMPPVTDLTSDAFETWLTNNGVPPRPEGAIDVEAAWQQLARLEKAVH